MRPEDKSLAKDIEKKLLAFNRIRPLPGISNVQNRICLVQQIIDSIRRIKYITVIRDKKMSSIYCDATVELFDPLKAAVWHKQSGNLDEAFWLVFLATHFGKNKRTGWGLARGTYGALKHRVYWDWITTGSDTNAFRLWLRENSAKLKNLGNFSNHRKYQSIDADSPIGTGAAIESYIKWVGKNHSGMIKKFTNDFGRDPRVLFKELYRSMNGVASFGRTARFDYLTMLGKLGLVEIEPDSTYMEGATGPKSGARLLFGGDINSPLTEVRLNDYLKELEAHLNLYFGMQILEDALCNWQKKPEQYRHFKG